VYRTTTRKRYILYITTPRKRYEVQNYPFEEVLYTNLPPEKGIVYKTTPQGEV